MLYKKLFFNSLTQSTFFKALKGHLIFQIECRRLARSEQRTKAPQEIAFERGDRSNFKFPTPIKGTGPTGSLRSSYPTARRAVKKRGAQGVRRTAKEIATKGKIVSVLSSVLQSWVPTGTKGHDTPNRMPTTRQNATRQKAPQRGRHQRSDRSNFKFSTTIRGNGTTGSLRSSYHTARRAVKKDDLKR